MISTSVNAVTAALETDGIVLLPDLVTRQQLEAMRNCFESRLRHLRWNDVDGYEMTERYRHMVQDVLMLDQAFVDVALHPTVKDGLREYIGPRFELVEAKGWKSLPTTRDFHGWHGDAWYDQTKVDYIPREVKLALYLTDVESGFFEYVRGSHRKQAPRPVKNQELAEVDPSRVIQARGPAGMAFLFDTSGIHRQSVPILERRYAVFLNYHDASIPLQKEDVEYNRYHPLLLNAAFLGGLTEEDRRILGFGNKTNYVPCFERRSPHTSMQAWFERMFDLNLVAGEFASRVAAKVRKLTGRR